MSSKKAIFFAKRACFDLIAPNRFSVPDAYQPRSLPPNSPRGLPYQLGYTTHGMLQYYKMALDDNGIAMMSHYIDHDSGKGHYYSPVKIAHYALGAFNDYLTSGQSDDYEKFKKHFAWLKDNSTAEQIGRVWRVPSTNPKYELEYNYISAISQGLVLSVLARGYREAPNEELLNLGEEALKPLTITLEDGGLLAVGKWGPCYEEYPCTPYSHVLNGFAFCLFGLDDFARLTGSEHARKLFNQGLDTFRKMVPHWFTGGWARYDLRDIYTEDIPNLATRHYQYLHADQMEGLYRITGDKFYKDLSNRFLRQVWNPIGFARAYWTKARKFL